MSPVTLAILDTGIDFAHPEFAGRLTVGYDFINLDDDPQDDNGHGTSVTGAAAAIANNSEGIAGLNWSAQIMPVKVLNSSGVGTYADVASGIVWAVNNGGDVINLSLGGEGIPPSSALLDAVNYAHSNGLVIVAAAGNSNSSVFYPAIYSNVIAVAATDLTNTRMANSNYGPEIDISAPGNSIFSTSLGGGYGYSSRTSMAAPYVSGLAAILKGIDPSLSPEEIEAILKTSALDLGPLGFDDFYGAGLIQADGAVLLLIVPTPSSKVFGEMEQSEEREQGSSSTQIGQVAQTTPTRQVTVVSTEVVNPNDVSGLISTSTMIVPTVEQEQVVVNLGGVSIDDIGVAESSENEWMLYLECGLVSALLAVGLFTFFQQRAK
jgi:subtilisin family serine protease